MIIQAQVRAAAIRSLLLTQEPWAPPRQLIEALLSCCRELMAAGEAMEAIELLDVHDRLEASLAMEESLAIRIVRADALYAANRFIESLEIVRSLREPTSQLDALSSEQGFHLRILESANLWQINRPSEAIDKLLVIRGELLKLPDSALQASCCFHLFSALIMQGDYALAREYALEAIVSARRCKDRCLEAFSLDNFGRLERMLCRWHGAREFAEQALVLFKELGHRRGLNGCLRGLGIIDWKRGRLADALHSAEECIKDAAQCRASMSECYGHMLKGSILLHQGHYDEAAKLFVRSDSLAPSPDSRPPLLAREFLGDVQLESENYKAALEHYNETFRKAVALVPHGDIVAELRRRRAECYLALGDAGDAHREATTAIAHCRDLGDRYEEAATVRTLAMAASALGDVHQAKSWFDQGFALYDDIETPYEWGKLWLAYGDWLASEASAEYAHRQGAMDAYQAASDHFERMGAEAKLQQVRQRMEGMARREGAQLQASSKNPGSPLRRPRGSVELQRKSLWAREQFGLITNDVGMLGILEDVAKLARSSTPILVLGESGSGKELIAHGLHRLSGRAGSFVPINCSALPREIIESELFGHTTGAFTGATRDKAGLLEVCSGGTVFLDEIGEMPIELQSRLLRFLETGEVRRVGAIKAVSVQTRVVAATNRDGAAMERGDGFRTDLYYRLAHAVIELPPLRYRKGDIELLVDVFLDQACEEEQKKVALSTEARARLREYSWPGNVRQLKAMIRRLVLLSSDGHVVAPRELRLDDGRAPTTLTEELEQAEKRRIVEAMSMARGSRAEAARSLGMPRTTLINKLRRFGLTE